MDTQMTVRAVAELSRVEELAPEKGYFLTYYREELLRVLQEDGYEHIEISPESEEESRPDMLAELEGRKVCLCMPPVPTEPMELQALSAAQCAYCERHFPEREVHYAALLTNSQEGRLYLLGPVLLRNNGVWQTEELERAQFLPFSRRPGIDRYSPIFGGAAMFKLSRMLIPHVLAHGELPRFTVQGAFADREQGENGLYAIMGAAPPGYLMLVERRAGAGQPEFRRPFFYYGERPHAELEYTRKLEGEPGLVELLDKTGRVLCAECLEAALYPDQLPLGKHYRWTLSLVADRCRPLKKEFDLVGGPLHEQILRDYARAHGEKPPQDFSVRVNTGSMRNVLQEPKQSYAELCGRVTHAEPLEVDNRPALLLSLLPVQDNDDVEVQVFVGETIGLHTPPQVGDVVECAGFMYASPDAVVEGAESWQDSGAVAAQQETREQRVHALAAYERYSGYSLAEGVVAAALARAGYTLQVPPHCHTREEATFTAQNADGHKLLVFVDTVTGGEAEPQYHYTEEQRSSILIRERSAASEGKLDALHCLVSLKREPDSESYVVQLLTEPPFPAIDTEYLINEATQCPLPGGMTEERACRITCAAIASQAWGEFARAAAEDMVYTSRVNGTHTVGKMEYIRYMAERKHLWEEQMGWPGMCMETGTIMHEGKRRPCYMIHCYGRAVGAAVVTLRGGFIAEMETVPPEANDTYTPDADCTDAPRGLYHPLRGRLIPFTSRQSPLQRFASAYLQECMMHKTGFISPQEDAASPQLNTGDVQFTLRKKGARWIKFVRNGPSFCDLAFSCNGRLFAVCAVETEKHPDCGGDIRSIISRLPEVQLLLDLSERYGLVPCVFPAMRNHTPNPQTTWNLWDARTLAPVFPEKMPDAAPARPSDWEMLNAATSELVRVAERSGGRAVGCHDVPDTLPHFWFYDAKGRLSWVITRTHLQGAPAHPDPTEAELQIARLLPGTRGYVMDIEVWGNAAHNTPAQAGSPLYLHLLEPRLLEP